VSFVGAARPSLAARIDEGDRGSRRDPRRHGQSLQAPEPGSPFSGRSP
jgi:hypothetical protein